MWDALTNNDRIPNWFLPITGELKLGGRYQLEGHAAGQVSECDPPNSFEVTWECGGNTSWVNIQLVSEGEGTKLTLSHIMLQDEDSEKHWKQYGPGATGVGWDLGFVGMELHIDTGQAVNMQESHAWMGSDNGKVFITKSADAWYEAHVASGEDPETARAMADETAKAYTGGQ